MTPVVEASAPVAVPPAPAEPVPEAPVEGQSAPQALEDIERDHILRVLSQNGGNRTATAETLKVSIRTLRNKLNLYREQGLEIE